MNRPPEYELFTRHTGGRRRDPESFASWLRALPVGIPTKVPERFAGFVALSHTVSALSRKGEGKFAYRTIDGSRWVCRLMDKDDE